VWVQRLIVGWILVGFFFKGHPNCRQNKTFADQKKKMSLNKNYKGSLPLPKPENFHKLS
jgi:hypothetical protein